jgi:hypothetical protein
MDGSAATSARSFSTDEQGRAQPGAGLNTLCALKPPK